MKAKILAGLVTALISGGAAMAQVEEDTRDTEQQSPDNFGGSGLNDTTPQDDDLIILDEQDVAPVPETGAQDEGVGGAGDQELQDQDAFGGAGQADQGAQQAGPPGIPMRGQGGVMLYCTPVEQPATGGSGDVQGGAPQEQPQSALPPQEYEVEVGEVEVGEVEISPDEQAFGGSGMEPAAEGQQKADMRGVSVLVGAGVEGYTGGLAPAIDPGATVNAAAVLRPTTVLGLELGYSGAANDLDVEVPGSGPDIVRNGALANLTVGLTASPIQPYVLGGFGMNWYNIRNGEALGFRDDTSSRIPVGVGLRTHVGHFTADARVNYNFLLSDDFAPDIDNGEATTGSYNGTINLGGTF